MFPKKKPGLAVGITVAKGKPPMGGGMKDLGSPSPMDGMGKKPMAPTAEHEAAESPEYEASEEYGAKLLNDIDSVGENHGMDSEQTRAFTADLLNAIAKCLQSGGEEEQGEQEGEEGPVDENAMTEADQGGY